MSNVYVEMLKKRNDVPENIIQAIEEHLKEPDPEPIPPPPPTEYEMLRDYALDLDYRLILLELGFISN